MAETRVKLTEAQAEVLVLLAGIDVQRDGAPSGPEISRMIRRRPPHWSYVRLLSLEKRGFVARLGTTLSGGQCWTITDSGRRVIAEEGRDG